MPGTWTRQAIGVFMLVAAAGTGVTSQSRQGSQSPGSDWKRLRSAHFTAVGNARAGDLRSALVRLEAFRDTLLELVPAARVTSPVQTLIVVLKDRDSFEAFIPLDSRRKRQPNVGGYFMDAPDINYIVLPIYQDAAFVFQIVLHEYTHDIVHRTLRSVPPWLDEGLADFYSTFDTTGRNGRRVIGRYVADRVTVLRDRPLIPLERLMSTTAAAKAFEDESTRPVAYAESWALVHYLMLDAPARKGQLRAYVQDLERGRSNDDAVRRTFGPSLAALQREVGSYVRRVRLNMIVLPPSTAPAAVAETPEQLSQSDADRLQGDLLARLQLEDEAEKRLSRALAREPADAGALLSMGLVRLEQHRHADAIDILQSVVEAEPSGFAGQYYLATALLEARRYEAAHAAYDRAITINPSSPDGWFGLSIAALALKRDSQAKAAMQQVTNLSSDPDWHRKRAYAALAAGREAVTLEDVEAYSRVGGFDAEAEPYLSFLSAIANWRLGRADAAADALSSLDTTVAATSWQANVRAFLQGRAQGDELLKRARDHSERTEAHAYIGIKAALGGDTKDAIAHLEWVKTRGDRSRAEYKLAVDELKRLQP